MINSTISHETKNPLNSILNQNLNLESIIEGLKEVKSDLTCSTPAADHGFHLTDNNNPPTLVNS